MLESTKLIPAPPLNDNVGFSVQTWIARMVQERVRQPRGSYHAWISSQFNVILPGRVTVGPSADPLRIFEELDRAVKTNDIYNTKVNSVRDRLRVVVGNTVGLTDAVLASRLLKDIDEAEVALFRPEIWIVDLSGITPDRRIPGQYPNEFVVDDLQRSEFEIIEMR